MHHTLISQSLDSLGIAFCLFDGHAHTLHWNNTFLRFFPEHDGFVHAGEPYAENLRRFYTLRLSDDERPELERYVADGIARHHAQTRPFVFKHRGRWLRVSSLADTEGNRSRIWVEIASPATPAVLPFELYDSSTGSEGWNASQLENVADGVLVEDAANKVIAFNRHFAQLYRIGLHDTVVGSPYRDLLARLWKRAGGGEESGAWRAALDEGKRFLGAPFELRLPEDRWVRVAVHPTSSGLQYSVHADITALKRQQRELVAAEHRARESEERLRAVAEELAREKRRVELSEARFRGSFDQSGIATCMLGARNLQFVSVNDALCRLLGASREGLLADSRFDERATLAGGVALPELVDGLRAGHTRFLQREGRLARADGSEVAVQLSLTPIRELDGSVETVMVHLEDIGARKRAEEQRDELLLQLEHQATHDMLTQLANRALLQRRLADALRIGPAPSAEPHALCFLDLDGFKQINDAAGHAAGDAALQRASALFRECVRPGDLVARVGGDEFGLLLWNCGAESALTVAHRIVQSLQAHGFSWQGERHALGVSIGIHLIGPDDTVDAAMACADGACYAAKHRGRNQISVAADGGPPCG